MITVDALTKTYRDRRAVDVAAAEMIETILQLTEEIHRRVVLYEH